MAKRKRSRSLDSYYRRPGTRLPKQSILIVCEGSKTELFYFDSLRNELKLMTVEVEIEPVGGAPISVVDRAIELLVERKRVVRRENRNRIEQHVNYDEVWCVFDTENLTKNPSFREAVFKARQNNIQLAISNPAFEYWYLIHFTYTDRPFLNANALNAELRNHIPNYEKNQNVFVLVFPLSGKAISNSRRCYQHHVGGQDFPNSSTQVHLLVEKLFSMSYREIPN